MAKRQIVNKGKILEVAVDLFYEKGYAATSIRDISRVMKISIATLYYYFQDKEALLFTVVEDMGNQLLHDLNEAKNRAEDPLDGLRQMMMRHIVLTEKEHKRAKIFVEKKHNLSKKYRYEFKRTWVLEITMNRRIVVLGGDGVGPEVTDVACKILENMELGFEILKPPSGESAIKKYGTSFPDETKRLCEDADAVLFGAAGSFSSDIVNHLRWGFDNYVNIRPIKYFTGAKTPLKDAEGIDMVILRENSEGFYPPGREGDISQLAEKWPDWKDSLLGKRFMDYGRGKFAIRIITENGVNRMMKFAGEFTQKRKDQGHPGKLTLSTKSNVLQESCGLVQRIVESKIKQFQELSYEHFYIDDMCRRVLRYPTDMDVILTTNMFGDILSDEAAELVGGMGMAPSACIGGKTPYFEPVHGSAPKYANKNVINPTAMVLSVKMMLDHFGMENEANDLENAVANIYREGKYLARDQGGHTTTREFGDVILQKLG